MKKHLPAIILSLFVLFNQDNYSQSRQRFSGDPDLFSGELTGYMGSNLTEKQITQTEEFISQWNSAMFNAAEMQNIMNSVNMLIGINARPVPHMINYIEMLTAFIEHDPERHNYPVWQKAFTHMLDKDGLSLQRINEFILTTTRLISENILYRSSSIEWKSENSNFSFSLEDSLAIIFNQTVIKGFNHIDTLAISDTSGSLCLLNHTWKGNGGRVTWERAGLDREQSYAVVDRYTIDLSRSEYHADSALFYFRQFFQTPVTGKLTDRIMSRNNPGDAGYPRFTSYRQNFVISNILPDIDYEGGLSMHGARLIGSGGDQDNARLIFYREGGKWLTAESQNFVFRSRGVSSVSTSILFTLENDTIYHPDMHLNYLENTKELSLNQNDKVISQSPWYNQFHQVDMKFGQLLWKMDEPEMRLTMPRGSSMGNANFESLNFFDRNQYQSLQGMDNNHPLFLIKKFSEDYSSSEIPAEEYARFLRRPLTQVRRQLLDLTLQGFIFYDTDTDLIRLRDRLYDYLQANIRRIDYDIINFPSSTKAPLENAILDLNTSELQINGIPGVYISSSQNVDIFTNNNTIILKRNRNFLFDGIINAGNLSFYGENFGFNYDKFNVSLQNIDSISMRTETWETDAYGQARLTNVKNLIRNVTGELNIDNPDNKSGRVDYPEFPRFSSYENSYVFYERPDIHNGVYNSEDFYFELYPFVMDSLNTFRNEELRFRGKLVSAGIFPDIEEVLILQKDYSLGINHTVPEGIPLYEGRGMYYHDIQLRNDGLRGSGRLDYLSGVLYSDDFLFFPDSMNTVTNDFIVEKQTTGTEFPAVVSKNNKVHWLPDKDFMKVEQKDNHFTMFNDRAGLDGSLIISSSGMSGSGSLTIGNAGICSENYSFGAESVTAGTSSFTLHDPEKPAESLSAENLITSIDLETRRGEFSGNQDAEMVSFPANSYIANPESFIWNMDQGEFEFMSGQTDEETGLKGARFISTDPGQDSLKFFSPHAVMDYNENLIRVNEVKLLEIADASIIPDKETILIGEKGEIFPLQDAKIVANRNNSDHEIYNAQISIGGKNDYTGHGYYDYLDEMNEKQPIRFDTIYINSNKETMASGIIEEADNFMLSPLFSFTGKAGLDFSRPDLTFSGATGLVHNCHMLNDQWLAFEDEIDPLDILIPVPSQPVSADGERIYSGIFVATDSVHIYPVFFSTRKNWADQLIVSAEGYMKFDPLSGEYRIASYEKLRDPGITGKIMSFNPDECIIRGEGPLELGVTLGQLEINALGHARNSLNINETSLEGIITLDFFLSEDALALITHAADSIPGEPVDSSAYYFERGLNELLGSERAESFLNQDIREGRQMQIPAELNKTFALSDIRMKWNKESRSYRSQGKIGVAFINGVPVNKQFTGYLEITKRRSGDYLDFYLELDSNNWYYFGYTPGTMQTFSSNPGYVDIIDDLSLRRRRMRVPSGETRYIYMLATDTRLSRFFRIYQSHLEGQTVVIPDEQPDDQQDFPD